MFVGGAFSNATIFALGIMPYISASIIIQLLGTVFPYFHKLQRDKLTARLGFPKDESNPGFQFGANFC